MDKSQTDLNFDEFSLKLIFGAFIFSQGKPKTLVSRTGNSHRSPFFDDLTGSDYWLTAMSLFVLDHFLVWLRELEPPAFQVVGENNVVCVMPFNGRTALRLSALGAVRPVA